MGPYFHFQINRSTGSGRKLQKIDLHTEGNKKKKGYRNSKTAIDRDLRFFALVYSYNSTTPFTRIFIFRSIGARVLVANCKKIDLHTEGNKNKKGDRNSKTAIDRDLRFFALVYSYKSTTPLGPNFHFQIDRRMGSGRKLQKIEYMGKKTSNSKTAIDRDLRFFALVCS